MALLITGNHWLGTARILNTDAPIAQVPAPTTPEAEDWWIFQYEHDATKVINKLAHLEELGWKWANKVLDIITS